MYALGEFQEIAPQSVDPRLKEVAEILELRKRVLAGSDAAYMSPIVRLLIEHEIPRLIGILAGPGMKRAAGTR